MNTFLWTVLITSLETDSVAYTKNIREYIVLAVTPDYAVTYACKVHNAIWIHNEIIKVTAERNKTNVISRGKVEED